MNKRKTLSLAALAAAGLLLAGCSSDADTVSRNLSNDAERFQIERRIVFFNGITDKYLLTIEGRCSVESTDSQVGGSLEVTCKLGPDEYKKHFLGLSDNVSYFVEQLEPVDSSEYHYNVIFKPESILPTFDLDTKSEDGPGH